jgi:hypothetical protein
VTQVGEASRFAAEGNLRPRSVERSLERLPDGTDRSSARPQRHATDGVPLKTVHRLGSKSLLRFFSASVFQVVLRVRVVGIDFQGFLELGYGLIQPPLSKEHKTQVIVCLRIAGVNSQGPLVLGHSSSNRPF